MSLPVPKERKLWLVRPTPEAGSAPSSYRPPAPSHDDSELLAGLKRGDQAAASALHDRTRPVVERTLVRLLGRGDRDHEDLAQKALIELVFTIDRFRGDCSLDSWAATITAHVVFKEIRRRKTERRLFDGVADGVDAPSSTDIVRESLSRSTLRRIQAHLAQMDEAKAWTFALHDICGYDLKEIAQITEVSVAAAQTRLVRGRRELHERIAADPELAAAMGRAQ